LKKDVVAVEEKTVTPSSATKGGLATAEIPRTIKKRERPTGPRNEPRGNGEGGLGYGSFGPRIVISAREDRKRLRIGSSHAGYENIAREGRNQKVLPKPGNRLYGGKVPSGGRAVKGKSE